LVAFSRIGIDVYEVEELRVIEPEPETWIDRIVKAFRDSLMNLGALFANAVVFFVAALPYMVIMAVFGWIVWKLLRKNAVVSKIKKDGVNQDEK